VGPGLTLKMEHAPAVELPWEIFHGRLLDQRQTMQWETFEAWNLFLVNEAGQPPEPLLSLLLDAPAGLFHVTRAILSYVWEAYDEGNNVILSRECQRWLRELVGTIPLGRFTNADDLRDEIICKLFQAVVGSSRLPLTSVESPLPQYSFGELAYFYRCGAEIPLRSHRDLIAQGLTEELSWIESAKLLETLLHAVSWEELREAADFFMVRWRTREGRHVRQNLVALLRTLFNEASLSPYTDLVDKALAFVRVLEETGHLTAGNVADFLGSLLRQLGRHLTAYDLVTFHHRGANYPDALLLNAALKACLEIAERRPETFTELAGDGEEERTAKRLRRRALRQGWLLRCRYAGHLVSDVPTSAGENTRVLPPPHGRVAEDQILYPHKRTKRLFEGDPLDKHLGDRAREVLRQSIQDLHHAVELRELGMAIFLDRPLDAGKGPREPDQTPLFSHLAFSRSTVRQRLKYLADDLGLIPDRTEYEVFQQRVDSGLDVQGLPLDAIAASSRPGSVSLIDARKVADDFLILRTTLAAASQFLTLYCFDPLFERYRLDDLQGNAPLLIVRRGSVVGQPYTGLAIYDSQLRQRLELDFDPGPGYESRGGIEYPVSPLRVLRVWKETDDPAALCEHDLRAGPLLVLPRRDF
jgi:hypothetical protein